MENQENESCIFDLLNLGTKLKQQRQTILQYIDYYLDNFDKILRYV